ncbi:hypothetical protein A9Q84_12995 [Halobacteriovorax marinus]|uniref:Uncharacterized protein n=1 Tax=Halobacteriovorax marinus TaxID=97084 RepID=A0A1Y5F8G6_9BACT|nr:hypothetical protein A9Q84_12995 [Halobacteriovorax marinus]
MKSIISLSILIFTLNASGSEIDSFLKREFPLTDSRKAINNKTRQLFAEAIERANSKDKGCSEKYLYKSLRKNFRNHVFGKLTPWIIATNEIERNEGHVRDTIYGDFKWYEAPIIGFLSKAFSDSTGHNINFGNYYIGTDKFEHFLGTGFNYFNKKYRKNWSTEKVLNIGVKAEFGFMGALTTGVISYADQVANFNGMRFWNHVLSNNPDILGEEFGPYVVCSDNKWEVAKPIDWLNYVDHAWDEGINCSKFRTKRLLKSVKKRLANYQEKTGLEMTCPLDATKLETAKSKYTEFVDVLINEQGHQSVK